MAETMEIQESCEKQLLSPTINDQFFDAEDGGQNKETVDNEDEDFLKKLDEAINAESILVPKSVNEPLSPKKISLDEKENVDEADIQETSLEDIEKLLKEEETLLKGDEKDDIKSNDVEPILDEKSENDLLRGLDDDNQNTEVNNEFEEILSSIQNGESSSVKIDENKDETEVISTEKKEQTPQQPTKPAELTREESNELLLELCESPAIIQDEQLSNDTGSNQEDSNEEESSESEKNKEEEDEQKDTEVQNEQSEKEKPKDDIINLEETGSSQSSIKNDDNEQNTQETIESDQNDQIEAQSTNEEENFKVPESKSVDEEKMEVDEEKMEVDESSECPTESESAESLKTVETTESSSQEEMKEEEKPKEIVIETIKKEEVNVKLNFMRKFASSIGKLSRSDLEELLLEKITESIVFRSESTELRTKCEKQDEIIDNLKQRIQSITKQYNDLDMIHKRIVKDLKERPDQPITPVKITRAVGLQVYQPHNSNNSNNLKQKVTSTTNKPTAKRPNDSDLSEKEAEAKRKKSNKIITPMRPPLSEKEKASLEKQEATIEQKIRTKVIKSDTVSSPTSTKPTPNGMAKTQSMERSHLSSTQSIDLTDEDDTPLSMMTQQPPALVAIQKNSFMSPRGLMRPMSAVRGPSPNILNRQGLSRHPAPLPQTPVQQNHPSMKKIPPRPTIKINNVQNGIIVSWTVDTLTPEHAEIHSYQIYAYEETRSVPTTESWKHVGDVKALLLPMAVTLTQFQEGQKYHFAVRAVDIHRRMGQFSLPKTW
ncbi:enolase-phosphatase E1-like [Chironomus tepperi]|uniref:enolase-phosphatase E1-like n=1 Tax=Chironomus tepperi TaxID=113505 RepID=UPI00391F671C